MTTTSHLQAKPDYFTSREKCLESERERRTLTNPRYRGFDQTHFTAGDIEQFQEFRDEVNGRLCKPEIDLSRNIFRDLRYNFWSKYTNANALSPLDTFKYVFYKFKKGIFVKILNGKLDVFLPFSNASFENEWSSHIKVNPRYENIAKFMEHISSMEGRRFNPTKVNGDVRSWYGNNCLVRYEFPINEGESNVACVKNLLEELCQSREIPDMEFFINKRDFPVLTRDGTEAYNNLWDSETQPLVSHNYGAYLPIFSMSITDRFADVLMVTWEDWTRVQSNEGKFFSNKCAQYDTNDEIPWNKKKPTAVFRGGTTGCGTTIDTNMRLKACHISAQGLKDKNGVPYLDAGINKWNLRPRKIQGNPFLQTIDVPSLTFGLSNTLTQQEQASHKYILNVDGHVTAFRLSMELSYGSVVLLVKSPWKIWYSHLLKPYEHYVPVEDDLSDLIEKIKWCHENDEKCEKIAKNARDFYDTYLCRKSILDYMQKILIDAKNVSGVYVYNVISPLNYQIKIEEKFLSELRAPETRKTSTDISVIPYTNRTHSLLKGLEYVTTLAITENSFEKIAQYKGDMFKSKTSAVRKFDFVGFPVAVKSTNDAQKMKENIHETYIGLKCINSLSMVCPNFSYIFGTYQKDGTQNVIVEHIDGSTLGDYILSREFNFRTFLSILLQISAALCVAQQKCSFVHYDLAPWNVMLKKLEKEEQLDYVLNLKQILRFKTDLIPVIIDFGKSHVICDDTHFGFTQMYKTSRIQDILTILSNCLHEILSVKETTMDTGDILNLANFMTGTNYRREKFTTVAELRKFLIRSRKYFTMLHSDKHQLENLTPYNFIKHINETFAKKYKLNFGSVKERTEYSNVFTGRQVFDFILSKTVDERLYTYMVAIQRMKGSTFILKGNKFESYCAGQTLYAFLTELRTGMENYATSEQSRFTVRTKMDHARYLNICDETMRSLKKMYSDILTKTEASAFTYDKSLYESNTTLTLAPYNQNTFLLPNEVEKILGLKLPHTQNPSQFFYTVMDALTHTGMFSLSKEDREFYKNNFDVLLGSNPILLTNNIANGKTLIKTAKEIYQKNVDAISSEKCDTTEKLLSVYNKIIQMD